ncbi:helix-turn-helix domain-containing protein [Methylobacterium sp. SD21]|uniref:helix-turn-helix domain-containing protein n=1 Tax=Methylobacterium litchii TaxID=3138810 RepID=UPI00313D65E1
MTAADRLLEVLAGAAPTGMSSAELCKATGLGPARAFPALHALEQRGAISSEWEKPEPGFEPRRRLYWIAGGADAP